MSTRIEWCDETSASNGLKGAGTAMYRVGKGGAGRLLDGVVWQQRPGATR